MRPSKNRMSFDSHIPQSPKIMNRKKFLITSSLTALGLSTFGSIVKLPGGNFEGDCETTNDILGPFYRADAPLRSDMITEGLAGTKITLKGTVFQQDCTTPMQNAMVEIWHCNAEGEYDNDSAAYHQRARLVTDETGTYSFSTILPGKYLNGELYRPSHIHYRVTEESSKELISQIYFKGDPHVAKDPWASKKKAELRVLEISPEDIMGNLAVNFDVYLSEK